MWSTWREQNVRCFEDHKKTKQELKNILIKSLLVGQGRIIFLSLLTFLNLWIFVPLLASLYTFWLLDSRRKRDLGFIEKLLIWKKRAESSLCY
jgi:hypothetical protein